MLSPLTSVTGTVRNATGDGYGAPCGGTADDDVWYYFFAPRSTVTINFSSIGGTLSATGLRAQLFSNPNNNCGTMTSIQCNTSNSGFTATGLTIGARYNIRVYSQNNTQITAANPEGQFTILMTVPAPSNDECADAISLTTGGTCYGVQGTLAGATASASIPVGCAAGDPNDDVWYKFVASSTNPTISLFNTSGFSSSAQLQLFSGSCGSLTSRACGTTSIAATSLTIGTTYYVRVYSNGSAAINASFDICVTDPTAAVTDSTSHLFDMDTVGKRLGFPWEINYGPDDSLWITEARGYRVVRMSAGRSQTAKDVPAQQVLRIPLGSGEVNFDRSVNRWPQGGMQGLAIHPEFMSNSAKRWVYIGYVFKQESCPSGSSNAPCIFRAKIIRCRFYFAADAGNPTAAPKKDTLVILDTLISNLPGSNDHNSGRLKLSPVTEGPDNTYKLYYTIGDMGAGQFNNDTRTMYSQNSDTCEGKIIRLNTEPDTDPDPPATPSHDYEKWRRWIPNDNPFTHSVNGLRTPVYSIGHRNPQGIVWGNVNGTWRLYSSEQGDKSDDELNIIKPGKDYGWPKVAGYDDDNYNTADNVTDGFNSNDIIAGQTMVNETDWSTANAATYENPIFSFFPWHGGMIQNTTGDIFTWPTIACSGLDIYTANRPGWRNSLLVPSLKYGLYRLKLNTAGDAIDQTSSSNALDTFPLLHGWRVRDIAIAPNGNTIWAIVDSSGSTSGPTGGFDGSDVATKDGGKVLRLSFKSLIVLPAEFLTFKGKLLPSKEIELEWEANVDDQHKHFVVEKSVNRLQFSPIGTVEGQPYRLIDKNPSIGNNYYRIKQVDLDGKVSYSGIINVVYHPSGLLVTVYPNPVKAQLGIRLEAQQADQLRLQVTDVVGRQVYSSILNAGSAVQDIRIDTKSWPSQLYVLKISSATTNEVLTVQKFVKQ
ncbi:MAG TPA: PQQ-dependent sugar dehydrogenase [Flavisolibacter sp.]|nr:PQQ-dependent sugar dehydrogenase [Flavisolibacter sp.]